MVGFERYLSSPRDADRRPPRPRAGARSTARSSRGIETKYDVQRRFMLAIWGIETQYGRVTGDTPIFQALATLAWEPRRAAFFRGELFDALHDGVAAATSTRRR